MATMASEGQQKKQKLHGRAFYESIGSPKYIVAPMVDQSEFAWRMLSRSFIPETEQSNLLAYTPMFHARHFGSDEKYRRAHFQSTKPEDENTPWLDGNPKIDRPLFVQFCANDPEHLLAAAKHAAPHCDAVDLNLGCPQGIARKGHYGAFLQEDQELIFNLINKLHKELDVPVTAKIRILDTKEETLKYAQNVLKAGASILTVHGRRREQKGHLTGLADWEMLKWLRESLPKETVMFANGNVLQHGDVEKLMEATGVDGVMSAEGNLSDPAIFSKPPTPEEEGREYWRGKDGKSGWRLDAVMRRYMDLLHKYALEQEAPERRPLFMPGDDTAWMNPEDDGEPPAKRQRKGPMSRFSEGPNMHAVKSHLFHLLRHLVSRHTDVRDLLAKSAIEGITGFEKVLAAVEKKVAEGLIEYEATNGKSFQDELDKLDEEEKARGSDAIPDEESSRGAIKRCKRPWWVAQPIIRPLPSEAMAKGAISLSKKDKEKQKNGSGESKKVEAQKVDEKKVDVETVESAEKKKEIQERDELVAG